MTVVLQEHLQLAFCDAHVVVCILVTLFEVDVGGALHHTADLLFFRLLAQQRRPKARGVRQLHGARACEVEGKWRKAAHGRASFIRTHHAGKAQARQRKREQWHHDAGKAEERQTPMNAFTRTECGEKAEGTQRREGGAEMHSCTEGGDKTTQIRAAAPAISSEIVKMSVTMHNWGRGSPGTPGFHPLGTPLEACNNQSG